MLINKTIPCTFLLLSSTVAFSQDATDTLKQENNSSVIISTFKNLSPLAISTNFTNIFSIGTTGIQTSSSGAPGSDVSLAIRGYSNRHYHQTPAIFLDGLPFNGSLNSIAPASIESIDIYKNGIQSNAPLNYSSDGILEITTRKSGERHSPWRFNIDVNAGFNTRAIPEYDLITDPAQYYEALHLLYRSFGYNNLRDWNQAGIYASENMIGGYVKNIYDVPNHLLVNPTTGKINPNARIKYQDDVRKTIQGVGLRHSYRIGASKVFKNAGLSLGAEYLKENSYILKNDFNRLNMTLNTYWKPSDKFTIGLNALANNSGGQFWDIEFLNNPGYNNPFQFMRMSSPAHDIYQRDNDGNIIYTSNNKAQLNDWGHSIRWLLENERASNNNLIRLNPYLKYQLSQKFNLDIAASWTTESLKRTEYNNHGYNRLGWAQSTIATGLITSQNSNQHITFNPKLTFDNKASLHRLTATLQYLYEGADQKAKSYYKGDMEMPPNQTPLDIIFNTNAKTHLADAKLVYNFNNRIITTARINYTNYKFSAPDSLYQIKNNNANINYAGQIAWRSKRNNLNIWLDYAKTSTLPSLNTYQSLDIVYNSFYGSNNPLQTLFYIHSTAPRQSSIELGLSYDVSNRISTRASVFTRQIKDAIDAWPIIPNNWSTPQGRFDGFGILNRGIEFNINYYPIQTRKVTWQTSLFVSHIRSKASQFNLRDTLHYGNGLAQIKGNDLNSLYAPVMTGINPNNGSPIYATKNGTTNDYRSLLFDDYKNMGNASPTVFGSWVNDLSIGKLSFKMAWSYALGGKVYDRGYNTIMNTYIYPIMGLHKDVLKSWTPENTSSTMVAMGNMDANNYASNFFISASWLSLKNVMVNYEIPLKWLGKSGYTSLNIYAAGENLLFFSARKGLNPNADFMGGSLQNRYIPMRTILMGVKIDL